MTKIIPSTEEAVHAAMTDLDLILRKAAALDKLERMRRDISAPTDEEPGWFIPGINKAGYSAPTLLEAVELANETETEEGQS